MLPDRQGEEYQSQLAGLKAVKSQEEEVVFKILFKRDSGDNEGA